MTLTDEQIAAIRDGCEGVTPGPWQSGASGFFPRHVLAQGTVDTHAGPVWGAIATCEHLDANDSEGRCWQASGAAPTNAAHIARCDPATIRALATELVERRAAEAVWRSNSRETFDAMVAMRNDINEHIPLPSIESDLARGPGNDVFCAEVAQGVVTALAAIEAAGAVIVPREGDAFGAGVYAAADVLCASEYVNGPDASVVLALAHRAFADGLAAMIAASLLKEPT